jgi:3-hydroxyacyl-[acyl-carrier-protein] dehydratase
MRPPGAYDRAGIERAIPHRAPFLLVDAVLAIDSGKRLYAVKRASSKDWWATSCPPPGCAMPHCLVLEALAQAGGVLIAESTGACGAPDAIGLLVRIRSCVFGRHVFLDDQVLLTCHLKRWRRAIANLAVRATVDGEMVVEAEIACMIRQHLAIDLDRA